MCRHLLKLSALLPILGVALVREARQVGEGKALTSYPGYMTNDELDRSL